MHNINVKITKSTPSTTGGFVNTLEASAKVKGVFGERTITRKMFIKTEQAMEVNKELTIDLDQFNVTTVNDTFEGRPVSRTWIKEKSALDYVRASANVINANVDARATVVQSAAAF